MTRKGNKLFLKIYVSEAKTLEEAIGKKGKLAHIICTSEKESQTFIEAIGVELTRKEWSDYEEDVPEMGFSTHNRTRLGDKSNGKHDLRKVPRG